jgi:hypothetical protein
MARETRIPKFTVFNILCVALSSCARNCRLVQDDLTQTQRREHMGNSTAPLSVLANVKRRAWQFLLITDEYRFFHSLADSKIWLSSDAGAAEIAKQLINTPKVMITIFWNPFVIHVLAALAEKLSFDTEYFIDYALTPIEQIPIAHAVAI